jgi:hypothetical protein
MEMRWIAVFVTGCTQDFHPAIQLTVMPELDLIPHFFRHTDVSLTIKINIFADAQDFTIAILAIS